MKLHLKAPMSPAPRPFLGLGKATTQPKEVDLSLTINFSGEQQVEVPGGKRLGLPGGQATFGIRRGQLRLTFQNCALPLEKVALSKPFKVSMEIERQKNRSSEIQAAAALDTRNIGAKFTEGSAEKANVEVFQVKKVGSEDKPSWIFESYEDRHLEGTLAEKLLGILCIHGLPCEMTADFTVRGEDIQITWGKLALTKDIHRNKLAVIERAIVLRYLKPLVEASPICQGRWQHG